MAERILKQSGFDAASLSGGYKTWEYATMKQSNEDIFSKDFIGKDSQIYQTDPERTDPIRPSFIQLLDVDAMGLQCPGPILKLKSEMDKLGPGERLRETASDPGFASDVASWAKMTGNTLVDLTQEKGRIVAVVEKGKGMPLSQTAGGSNTTLIVFRDDMDKALASLVIANGAASAGKRVTMFYTFWGLNVIKKVKKPAVKKDLLGRMFGMMLAPSLHGLKLSKLHMVGMGTWMMKGRMKSLKIDSLQEMLDSALKSGVRMVACNMSMEVMGVKMEELVDGVEAGGVAAMLEAADTSRATLFI
jgi:peroxiredoxin family protein/TusA-related sulfurtransferase